MYVKIVKKAYHSVLMMQDRTPPGPKFEYFDYEVKKRAKQDHDYDWGSTPVSMGIIYIYTTPRLISYTPYASE